MVLRQESVPWALIYSSWARCRVCTRVWPRYSGEKQIPRCPRDDTGPRGRRAGGSEDPPLQPTGVERAEVGMAAAFASKAAARPPHSKVRQWRASAKVNEHNEERSLERLVDMEVSRKKD